MTFQEFEEQCPSTLANPIAGDYSMEDMRLCWNAAIAACEAIVAVRYDELEPWLEPGDLTKALVTDALDPHQ